MKKIFIVLLLGMIMSFGFCSCSSDDDFPQIDNEEQLTDRPKPFNKEDLYGIWKAEYYSNYDDYSGEGMIITPNAIFEITYLYYYNIRISVCEHSKNNELDIYTTSGIGAWELRNNSIVGDVMKYNFERGFWDMNRDFPKLFPDIAKIEMCENNFMIIYFNFDKAFNTDNWGFAKYYFRKISNDYNISFNNHIE